MVGKILLFGGQFEIQGWALCDGRLLSIAQNSAIGSLNDPDFRLTTKVRWAERRR